MPRGYSKEPGFKKLPNVPYRSTDAGPQMYDTDGPRGPLCYVPREPVYRVQDFGGEPTGRGSLTSPARADFTLGAPQTKARVADSRVMPESQLDGSYNANAGNGAPRTSQQRKGMNLAGESER